MLGGLGGQTVDVPTRLVRGFGFLQQLGDFLFRRSHVELARRDQHELACRSNWSSRPARRGAWPRRLGVPWLSPHRTGRWPAAGHLSARPRRHRLRGGRVGGFGVGRSLDCWLQRRFLHSPTPFTGNGNCPREAEAQVDVPVDGARPWRRPPGSSTRRRHQLPPRNTRLRAAVTALLGSVQSATCVVRRSPTSPDTTPTHCRACRTSPKAFGFNFSDRVGTVSSGVRHRTTPACRKSSPHCRRIQYGRRPRPAGELPFGLRGQPIAVPSARPSRQPW